MISTDIVIVDSGVNLEHPAFNKNMINGIALSFVQGEIQENKNIQDVIGHGTAVYGIISKNAPFASIYNMKVWDNVDVELTDKELILILQYIKKNIKCKIVNLSLGVKISTEVLSIQKVCEELVDSGMVLIAAFSNDGSLSYPACLESVIGVEASELCTQSAHYEYVENSAVNIRARGAMQRVAWYQPQYAIFGGNSFACAYVSAYAFNIMMNGANNRVEVLSAFKKIAIRVNKDREHNESRFPCAYESLPLNNVALFPFNKEMHSLVRFAPKLNFNIKEIYDVIHSGRVGVSTNNLLTNLEEVNGYTLRDIKKIDWQKIDTLILGHMDMLMSLLKSDIREVVITEAVKHKVNLVSFDPLDNYLELFENSDIKVYWPQTNLDQVPHNLGKLYNISKPVVGVFGTSSQQGKFTLQMLMKYGLEKEGYQVGCIGTEPHARLLGMEWVYPMGYNSAVSVTDQDAISVLNNMMNSLCEKEYDIIMVGSQANTIPLGQMHINAFPCKQFYFLCGTKPDAVVLCVNPFDSNEYIQNTIKFLEGAADCKVLALVVYPMTLPDDWRGVHGNKIRLGNEECVEIKNRLFNDLKLPVFILGWNDDMSLLCESIVSFFS